jgi:predicted Zn-dependent peptidase
LEIAEQVESVGASLNADATADYFLLSLKTVSADFAEILELAGQLLFEPTFPEVEVELERRLVLQDIRSQQEQPLTIAFEQLRQGIYQNHPYALSGLGTEATVSQLSRADLQRYHQTYFRPDNMVISLAGRVTSLDAVALVEKVFGDWQVPSTPLPTLTLPTLTTQPRLLTTPQQTQQSIVMLGYLAPAVQNADYTAMKLLSTYLGNGLSSRLFVELREKRGLAYEVSAFYPTRMEPSPFVVYMGTAPENTAIALSGLRTEVELLCTAQLESDALCAAKNKLLGQYALGKQTNAQIAQVFGWYETLGLGIEFDTQFQQQVAGVTAAMAQQAACQYFLEPYVSLVGPEAAINSLVAPAAI